MLVTLLRHAPTRDNLRSNYLGRSDPPLGPEGEELARLQPTRPDAARVFTSPLRRARRTAEILYPNAAILVRPNLAEMDFGKFEGRNWRDLTDDPDYRAWLDSNCEAPCPGGEDKAGFTRRCREDFRRLLLAECAAGAGTLDLVTHGGVIMAILSGYAAPERGYFEWHTECCGGFALRCDSPGAERPLRLTSEIAPIKPPEAGQPPQPTGGA